MTMVVTEPDLIPVSVTYLSVYIDRNPLEPEVMPVPFVVAIEPDVIAVSTGMHKSVEPISNVK